MAVVHVSEKTIPWQPPWQLPLHPFCTYFSTMESRCGAVIGPCNNSRRYNTTVLAHTMPQESPFRIVNSVQRLTQFYVVMMLWSWRAQGKTRAGRKRKPTPRQPLWSHPVIASDLTGFNVEMSEQQMQQAVIAVRRPRPSDEHPVHATCLTVLDNQSRSNWRAFAYVSRTSNNNRRLNHQ
jgi:hypothetical protein